MRQNSRTRSKTFDKQWWSDKIKEDERFETEKGKLRKNAKTALELAGNCLKGDDLIDLLVAAYNIYCVCYGPDRSGCNVTNRGVKKLSPKLYDTFSFILEQGGWM